MRRSPEETRAPRAAAGARDADSEFRSGASCGLHPTAIGLPRRFLRTGDSEYAPRDPARRIPETPETRGGALRSVVHQARVRNRQRTKTALSPPTPVP